MRSLLIGLGVLLVGGIALSRLLTTDPADFPPQDGPPNPLPACPDSPNCVRTTWTYPVPVDTLFDAARAALNATDADALTVDTAARRLDAVYRVVFFKDDVVVIAEPYEEGAALHIRSASRVGQSDLGVNGRRVRRIQRAIADRL